MPPRKVDPIPDLTSELTLPPGMDDEISLQSQPVTDERDAVYQPVGSEVTMKQIATQYDRPPFAKPDTLDIRLPQNGEAIHVFIPVDYSIMSRFVKGKWYFKVMDANGDKRWIQPTMVNPDGSWTWGPVPNDEVLSP